MLREQQCDPWARLATRPPAQSPRAASLCLSQPLQRHLVHFHWHFIALCRYAPKIFGSIHCMEFFFFVHLFILSPLFLLCYTQKLPLRSCRADALNFSLVLIVISSQVFLLLDVGCFLPGACCSFNLSKTFLLLCSAAKAKLPIQNRPVHPGLLLNDTESWQPSLLYESCLLCSKLAQDF